MKWINIKDQLPEIETAYLILLSDDSMEVDCMEYDDHGDLIWSDKHKCSIWNKVTHWMELPELPTV